MNDKIPNTQTSYDQVAAEYAERFKDEMDDKPFDRECLHRLTREVGALGPICDLGCGPGQIARYLHRQGVDTLGVDLSPRMIAEAQRLNPDIPFHQGDILSLPDADESWGGIAAFYRTALRATAAVSEHDTGAAARISVGNRQEMVFRETDGAITPYDGHHVAVYIADFSGPHGWLVERGLLSEESNPYQYRFQVIADPESGRRLSEIEHEVRSATHPMYMRPLVNRNAAQRQATYVRGRDAFVPGLL